MVPKISKNQHKTLHRLQFTTSSIPTV